MLKYYMPPGVASLEPVEKVEKTEKWFVQLVGKGVDFDIPDDLGPLDEASAEKLALDLKTKYPDTTIYLTKAIHEISSQISYQMTTL
jgi:hypothetical protein